MAHPVSSSDPYASSFKAQIADSRLRSVPARAQILSGTFQSPKIGAAPKRFEDTCENLLKKISDSVHKTMNALDFNGTPPYLKLLQQLKEGKKLREAQIDSRNEPLASTCVGMAYTLLQNLPSNVPGVLTVQREIPLLAFEHAAVIIECQDGFVLLDPRALPGDRIFSVPFGAKKAYPRALLEAGQPGSPIPLTVTEEKKTFAYCTGIENSDDLVLKHFVMERLDAFIPIAFYNPDGSARKSIKIYPSASEVVLIDYTSKKAETVAFRAICEGKLFPKLEAFMAPNYPYAVPSFHIPMETIYNQLLELASYEKEIGQLFTQIE